jgi:hypothetical protein
MGRGDDERREVRAEQHLRRLGTRHPRCACGETVPAALERDASNEVVCYECARGREGRGSIERDHIAGQHNDPSAIVPMPGNAHRLASDEMRDWPDLTARNPHGSPLRWGAGMVRGWLDRLFVILEFARLVPAVLEELDERLSAHLGARWWEVIGFRWPR